MIGEEINFDGIVGPTHNYSGLSRGNVASLTHREMISSPKKAALQGLEKMKYLHDLGVPQAVLPPQERPFLPALRDLGFNGSNSEVIEKASATSPELYRRCCSASAMWAANAAWITPSCDSADRKVHITPANLSYLFHRSIEANTTHAILSKIFADSAHFTVHAPVRGFSDEGSANHMLLCPQYGDSGVHIFVHGRSDLHPYSTMPRKFPARQTLEAAQAIIRRHELFTSHSYHLRQHPDAIDAGVFHNDVIAVSNLSFMLCHEKAFVEQEEELNNLRDDYENLCDCTATIVTIKEEQVSLADAVASYLFNSQLVVLPDGNHCLIAPMECREMPAVFELLNDLIRDPAIPLQILRFIDVHESMANGGGPACLRLRAVLSPTEKERLHQPIIFHEGLYTTLREWVETHYRDSLSVDELADPKLYDESCTALDALTNILQLGSVYSFQHG